MLLLLYGAIVLAALLAYAVPLYLGVRFLRSGRRWLGGGLLALVAIIAVVIPAYQQYSAQRILTAVEAAEILPDVIDVAGKRVLVIGSLFNDRDTATAFLTIGGADAVFGVEKTMNEAAQFATFADIDALLDQAQHLGEEPAPYNPEETWFQFGPVTGPVGYDYVFFGASPPYGEAPPSPFLGRWLALGPSDIGRVIYVRALLERPDNPATPLAESRPLYLKGYFQEVTPSVPLWPLGNRHIGDFSSTTPENLRQALCEREGAQDWNEWCL